MEEKFKKIKNNIPELIMFLKAMPKGADLHNHSLGGSYAEFVYEDAVKKNSYYDLRKNIFLNDIEYENSDKNSQIISIDEFEKNYTDNMFNNFSVLLTKNEN